MTEVGPNGGTDQGGPGRDSVLGKVAAILDAFDDEHPRRSFTELCECAGLPRSTVHRTVSQLLDLGWLERRGDQYLVGIRLFELGGLVAKRFELREVALPFMEDIYEATHEVVHLGILDGFDVVYVEKIGGRESARLPTRVGGRFPANCTAVGKVMLAFADDGYVDELIDHGLGGRTPHSVTDAGLLRAQLAEIRETGVGFDYEEGHVGIHCAAAPIRGSGRAVGAVSVAGRAYRIDVERIAPTIKAVSVGIWRALFPSRGGVS